MLRHNRWFCLLPPIPLYSHSIVPGGLEVVS
jgi:hypothetical protein